MSVAFSPEIFVQYFGIQQRSHLTQWIQNNNFKWIKDYTFLTQLLKINLQFQTLSNQKIENPIVSNLVQKHIQTLTKKKSLLIKQRIKNISLMSGSSKTQLNQQVNCLLTSADPLEWSSKQKELEQIDKLFCCLDSPQTEQELPSDFFKFLYKKAAIILPPRKSLSPFIASDQVITWAELIQRWGDTFPSKKQTARSFLQKHPYYTHIAHQFTPKNSLCLVCKSSLNLSFKDYLRLQTFQTMLSYLLADPSLSDFTIQALKQHPISSLFKEANRIQVLSYLAMGYHIYSRNQETTPPRLFTFFCALNQLFFAPTQKPILSRSDKRIISCKQIIQWFLYNPNQIIDRKQNLNQIPWFFIYQCTRNFAPFYEKNTESFLFKAAELFFYFSEMHAKYGKTKLTTSIQALQNLNQQKLMVFSTPTIKHFILQNITNQNYIKKIKKNKVTIEKALKPFPKVTARTNPSEILASFLLYQETYIDYSDILSFSNELQKYTCPKCNPKEIFFLLDDFLLVFEKYLNDKKQSKGFKMLTALQNKCQPYPHLSYQDILQFLSSNNVLPNVLDQENLRIFQELKLSPDQKASPLKQLKYFSSLNSSTFYTSSEIQRTLSQDFQHPNLLPFFQEQKWVVQKCLGKGALGVVYQMKSPDASFAVKVIPNFYAQTDASFKLNQEFIGNEALLLNESKKKTYPNSLIKLFGLITKDKETKKLEWHNVLYVNRKQKQLFSIQSEKYKNLDLNTKAGCYIIGIVMECIPCFCLKKRLNFNPYLDLFLIETIGYQIATALSFLHKNKIIHRDLKPDNILTPTDKNRPAILCDFGSLEIFNEQAETAPSQFKITGTPQYMSPEAHDQKKLTSATDIFSYGTLLYEMVVGHLPYDNRNTNFKEKYHENPSAPFTQQIEIELKKIHPLSLANLIRKCLQINPHKRPKASDILVDPFFHHNVNS